MAIHAWWCNFDFSTNLILLYEKGENEMLDQEAFSNALEIFWFLDCYIPYACRMHQDIHFFLPVLFAFLSGAAFFMGSLRFRVIANSPNL